MKIRKKYQYNERKISEYQDKERRLSKEYQDNKEPKQGISRQ